MRYIKKSAPPSAFVAWKTRYGSDINYGYDLLDTTTRAILKDSLLAEQGGICAYTGVSIEPTTCHIEHVKAQKHCEIDGLGEELDYQNMVACFPGPDDKKQCAYGAHPKKDWPKPTEKGEFISPLTPTCEQKFSFSRKGEISDADPAAKVDSPPNKTIKQLRLSNGVLNVLRHEAINATLEPKPGKALTLEQAEKRLKHLQAQTPTSGFDEFCFVLKQRLQVYISDLQQRQAALVVKPISSRTK